MNSNLIFYNDDSENIHIEALFEDENIWLTQAQIVDLYQTSKSNVSEHIKHIFEDGELNEDSVVRNIRITA
ncbi:MAG: cell filamentation protein Fic, partial [Lactococcus raffinolactis]